MVEDYTDDKAISAHPTKIEIWQRLTQVSPSLLQIFIDIYLISNK